MALVQENDVLQLNISVHNIQRVHVVQGRRELYQERLELAFADPSFRFHVAAEITTGQELHDQMRSSRSYSFKSLQKATDQRAIRQFLHDAGLLLDPFPLLGVLHLRPFICFDSYFSSGEFVPGDPNGAETTNTYHLPEGVKIR